MDPTLLRVMSFNIRGASWRIDGINRWENRAGLNVATIRRHAPDLIGLQELRAESLATYREELPGYAHVLGPESGSRAPHEFNAIFFDPARVELVEAGGFWLSETPEAYSSAWRTNVVRSANWARLRWRAAGYSFVHLNTHLDHVSALARAKGSELILRRLKALQTGGVPAIVTGDFNSRPSSAPYRSFMAHGLEDTFLAAGARDAEDPGTFHAFRGRRYRLLRYADTLRRCREPMRIDWILLSNGLPRLSIEAYSTLRDHDVLSGIYPSDHYPVLATLAPAG